LVYHNYGNQWELTSFAILIIVHIQKDFLENDACTLYQWQKRIHACTALNQWEKRMHHGQTSANRTKPGPNFQIRSGLLYGA